jgi:hypothetical protein
LGLSTAVPFRGQLFSVETDDSFLGGGRAGYWFRSVPTIGVALDAFYFEPDVEEQTVDALAIITVQIPEIFDQRITIGVGVPVRLDKEDVPTAVISPDLRVRWRLRPTTNAPPRVPHSTAWAMRK